jgi:hypothetical protein
LTDFIPDATFLAAFPDALSAVITVAGPPFGFCCGFPVAALLLCSDYQEDYRPDRMPPGEPGSMGIPGWEEPRGPENQMMKAATTAVRTRRPIKPMVSLRIFRRRRERWHLGKNSLLMSNCICLRDYPPQFCTAITDLNYYTILLRA